MLHAVHWQSCSFLLSPVSKIESIFVCNETTQVAKLCALAHIEVPSEGGGGGGGGNLDVAAVQRDVGAMLRCMQTMRRDRQREEDRSGGGEQHPTGEVRGGEVEDGIDEDGPWGGAVPWAAPLQEVGFLRQMCPRRFEIASTVEKMWSLQS